MKNWQKLFLALIILLATVLRFWDLGKNPPSPDWDEVAIGYNAHSLLETGRDEYGIKYPLVFRSFDDYKTPLYFYLTVPMVKIFGLNVFAVRFSSAAFGVLAVLGTYFLVQEIFRKKSLALLAAFLLAISPWHIYFSRIAFEANTGAALNIWAAFFFLYALRKKPWLIIFSACLFGLALYAYHSERVFTPLLVLGLAFIFRQKLWQMKKPVLVSFLVGLIFALPVARLLTQKGSLQRFQGTSVYSDKTPLLERNIVKLEEDQAKGNKIGLIFDNRRITYVTAFISGYISHFSPNWLFLAGDEARHHAPDVGLLYLWDIPFLLAGIFFLLSQKGWQRAFIFWWFFISPIAAAPTSGTPHAVRTIVFLPTFQIFTALGLIVIIDCIDKLKKPTLKISAILFITLFLFLNFLYFIHMYATHMPIEYSKFWQYGYREAVDYVKENGVKYDKIVVSTKLEQPHMFFLFYLKYDPKKYLAEGGTASGGFAEWRNKFDKYEFRVIDWDKEEKNPKILYIGTPPKEITSGIVKTIYYLNGEEAIRIAVK